MTRSGRVERRATKATTKTKSSTSKTKASTSKTKASTSKTKASTAIRPAVDVPSDLPAADRWARIERWIATTHPTLDLQLRSGASASAIAAAEKALDVSFPPDFRESLGIHDGQDDHCAIWWMPIAQRLGSLESITRCWRSDRPSFRPADLAEHGDRCDRSGRVRQVHFHPKHIPIAGSPHWDYDRVMLDFAPGPEGTTGQVIARRDIDLVFVAGSFGAYLERIERELVSGATRVSED